MLRSVSTLIATLAMTACAIAAEQSFEEANSGLYELETTHASLIWRVKHQGLSYYTARFTQFDAQIEFNPQDPVQSSVTAQVNPLSVETDHPTKDSWDQTLATDSKWFNGEAFPDITFASKGIERTGDFTGIITGDLTFLGVTKEIELNVTYNGTGNAPWFGARDLIGFSATGTLKRSDFGMTALLPNIGDEVEIIIEAEFLEAPTETAEEKRGS